MQAPVFPEIAEQIIEKSAGVFREVEQAFIAVDRCVRRLPEPSIPDDAGWTFAVNAGWREHGALCGRQPALTAGVKTRPFFPCMSAGTRCGSGAG